MPKNLIRALRLVNAAAPGLVAGTIVLAFAQSFLPLVSLYFLKLAIDLLTTSHGLWTSDVAVRLGWFIALSGVFYLVHLAVRVSGVYIGESLSLHVTEKTQEMIAAKSNRVALSYYEDPEYFDTLHQ